MTSPSKVSPTLTEIQQSVGNAELSKQLHSARKGHMEAFNQDHRAYHSLLIKSGVYAGFHGCSFATAIIALRKVALSGGPNAQRGALSVGNVAALTVPLGVAVALTLMSYFSVERRFMECDRQREEWEVRNFRQGELDEMRQIYLDQGFQEDEADQLVTIISRNDKILVDVMMSEELGYSRIPLPTAAETVTIGAVAASSFCANALLPQFIDRLKGKIIILGALGVCLSVMQSKLLFGAYANTADHARTTFRNLLCFAIIYHATKVIASILSKR